MIESLHIKNFAIIDTLDIDFKDRMIVLTGETGAGKSIIIDAIGQLLGNRTHLNFIKTGCDQAFIEGVFVIENNQEVLEVLDEFGFEKEEKLVVSKKIQKDGKTTVKMNYRNTSLTALKKIMPLLVDIHSQFETHTLFDENNHLSIIDDIIGSKISLLLKQYQEAYFTYKDLLRVYQNTINEELSDEQLEFYKARLDEINEVDIETIDVEELEKEKQTLQAYEKNYEKITKYQQYMSSNHGVLTTLNQAIHELEYLSNQSEYQDTYSKMYDMYYGLNDLHEIIMDTFNSTNFDEYRLNEIQGILFKINGLKRKHGQSISAIIEAKKELENKIEIFKNRDSHIAEMKKNLNDLQIECAKWANDISVVRKKEALKFAKLIEKELADLYLKNVDFEVCFKEVDYNKFGKDKLSFMISTNSGNSLQPLNKVVSGGELSRIMLAIKTISLQYSSISTIIFDEADSGVSGKVAESIGHKMKIIAKNKQVLCITHLSQVASFADYHYVIEKQSQANTTKVIIKLLDTKESINELAKMISGKELTKQSIEHAKSLKNKNTE